MKTMKVHKNKVRNFRKKHNPLALVIMIPPICLLPSGTHFAFSFPQRVDNLPWGSMLRCLAGAAAAAPNMDLFCEY